MQVVCKCYNPAVSTRPPELVLPPAMLDAVSTAGGGRIALVVGAGCSVEPPTSLPNGEESSRECHRKLVANRVLVEGDCHDPKDLSCLADTVFRKTGSKSALVDQLRYYNLETPQPNNGHLLAAALLCEGAVSSILTLNFDLSLTMAISELGVGEYVGIINCSSDFGRQRQLNLYYLNGNATATDPEEWILRTDELNSGWRGRWEEVIAAKVIANHVVIFVGMGSPAAVLVEAAKFVKDRVPKGTFTYQVDPGDRNGNVFFQELGLDQGSYIKATWCEFMKSLSDRLVLEQRALLESAATAFLTREGIEEESIDALLDRFEVLGLVGIGKLRAAWTLDKRSYSRDEEASRESLADLLLAVAFLSRQAGVSAVLCEDGVVEFRRANQITAALIFLTGNGTKGWSAIDAELPQRLEELKTRPTLVTGAIIAHTRDGIKSNVAPPVDVVHEDSSASIINGPTPIPFYHIETLRRDPTRCREVIS